MALSTRLRTAGDTHSSISLVRSKSQGKVPRLEIKNQTYDKLRQRHKKVKPFKYQGVWLLPTPTPPPPSPPKKTGWDTRLLQGTFPDNEVYIRTVAFTAGTYSVA